MELNGYSHISVPSIYHKILSRENIWRIIDGATLNEVICTIAPYGCGKTLAIISWLQERGKQARWLNLSEISNNESELIMDLTSAVMAIDKNSLMTNPFYLNNPRAFLLNAGSNFKYSSENQKNSKEKANSNSADTAQENLLVIDNFHFISDISLLRFIKDFILEYIGCWQIIIISRAELPPIFNDLILKGHIRLITPENLNFTLQEVIDYFTLNGFEISEDDASKIHENTEGWAAALNAIITASNGGDVGYNENANSYIMTFFEMEVWCGLRQDIKDFLLKTSILEKLTPSVCYAVTGTGATLPILKWLSVNGLFISKLNEEDTYRYHRVFRDFLLNKLSLSNINEAELYTKVAWWFFEKNEIANSFPYFFKADDYYGINQVLKILNPAELGIENYLEMADCITALNVESLKSYPILVARIAMIHFLKGNVKELQNLSKIFNEWLESGILMITSEEYGEYIWEAGWLRYIDPDVDVLNNKDHEEWSNYEEYVPNLKPIHVQRFAVLRLPSAMRGIRDYCESLSSIDKFIDYNEVTERSIIRGEYALCEMDLLSAEYAYELENFAKAEELARKIMTISEYKQSIDLYCVSTVLLVKIMRAVNTTKEIDMLINRAHELIVENNHNYLLPNFHAFEICNRLKNGELGFTEIFLEENEKYKNSSYYYLLYRQFAYVRALISLDNYSEAILLLGNIELLCITYKRTIDLIEVNILRAVALYGLGYEEKACESLILALNEAGKYGFIRIFSDDAELIWNILESVRKQVNSKYVQNIIISCKKSLSNNGYKFSEKKYSHIELTKTELKILKSLQAGMSYIEISLDNNIRISTVKSHVHSIYSKLEVSNKTSAVIAAQNQGIID